MKKKLAIGALALCVAIIGAIWFINQRDAVNREKIHAENAELLRKTDSIHRRAQSIQDSLKRFNPDPLLTVHEAVQRTDELIGHVSYTKKMLAEKAHRDLIKSPDTLLLSTPQTENIESLFIDSGNELSGYNLDGLKIRLNRFIIFNENYTGADVTALREHLEFFSSEPLCKTDGYDCYALLINKMNLLIASLEAIKIDMLNL